MDLIDTILDEEDLYGLIGDVDEIGYVDEACDEMDDIDVELVTDDEEDDIIFSMMGISLDDVSAVEDDI